MLSHPRRRPASSVVTVTVSSRSPTTSAGGGGEPPPPRWAISDRLTALAANKDERAARTTPRAAPVSAASLITGSA